MNHRTIDFEKFTNKEYAKGEEWFTKIFERMSVRRYKKSYKKLSEDEFNDLFEETWRWMFIRYRDTITKWPVRVFPDIPFEEKYKKCVYWITKEIDHEAFCLFWKSLSETTDEEYKEMTKILEVKFFGEWRDVIYEDPVTGSLIHFDYEVNQVGDIRSKDNGIILKQLLTPVNYFMIDIKYNHKPYRCRTNRVVAFAWIPNPEGKEFVDHKDSNKRNNYVENLQWVTAAENSRLSYERGEQKPHPQPKGFDSPNSKVDRDDPMISETVRLMSEGNSCETIRLLLGDKWGSFAHSILEGYYTEISDKYPEVFNARQHQKYPRNLSMQINDLIIDGYDNSYIINKLNLERTRKVRRRLDARRKRMRKIFATSL